MDIKNKLELQWTNKNKALYFDPASGKYEWVNKKDPRVSEPRILVEKHLFGDKNTENILIKGDNLLALKALLQNFQNKIKVVYIDPPFNTGSAFMHYDDGLEHSIWLTMMRDRLELIHKLLNKEGAIFIEIDDTEYGYLRLLMDEIFGRSNYVTTVSIKRSAATGHKAINPGLVNVTEYILAYAKNKAKWTYKQQFIVREKYDKQYSYLVTNFDEGYKKWAFVNLFQYVAKSLGFHNVTSAKKHLGNEEFNNKALKFAFENAKRVIRFALPNYQGVSQAARELIDQSKKDISRIYLLPRDKYSKMYFYKGNRILFLGDKIRGVDGQQGISEALTNFWDDIAWQGIASEGGVEFPKGKKPEKLIRRIIEMSSDVDDYVLDSFAGSGTTGAVAHKLGRKWIMVELGDQAETHCIKRLKRVINGEDQTGVSKIINWKGGGGFKYFELGDSLFVRDDDLRLTVINPKMYNGALIRAVLKVEGFKLVNPDNGLHGMSGTTAAHVTEQYLSQDYIDTLLNEIGDQAKFIVIYAKTISSKLKLPDDVEVKRIPEILLKRFNV